MPDITVAQLREQVNDGYNLAAVVPLDHDINDLTPLLAGVPVLKEAAGALGVLRALEVRMGPIQRSFYLDGQAHRLLHLVFTKDTVAPATLHDYIFKVEKEERHYADREA